jgi:AraC-like DNA-binding protein
VRQEKPADLFLGAFIFLSALFVLPWMAGFAGWYDQEPYRDILFYTPFIQGLFLGPMLFYYVKSVTNSQFRFQKKDLLHFLPGAAYLAWNGVVVVIDKLILHRYFLINGRRDPHFDTWYSLIWLLSLTVYLLMSIRYYRLYRLYIPLELSFSEGVQFRWLRNFLYAFTVLACLSIAVRLVDLFRDLDYAGTWYYYFSFAVIVYYIAIAGYTISPLALRSLRFEPQLLVEYGYPLSERLLPPGRIEEIEFEEVTSGPAGRMEISAVWVEKLAELMDKQKVFRKPELTLSEVARSMGTNSSVLSKVINSHFGLNFNDYINRQRVGDVVQKMTDPAFSQQTFLSIAYDAGFNSKSTFNRAFLKFVGMSPRDYLLNLQRQDQA